MNASAKTLIILWSTFWALSFINPNTWHLICNNFNLNFIFGTVCLCVCVCAFSLRWESPDMILGDEPFISEVVLSHYVKTTMNKQLLISESHDDSNWCTPYREKSDQHDTRFRRLVHVWPSAICISCGPHITTFRTFINRVEQGHCSWEKELLTQSIARRLTDPWVRIQFLSRANQWSSEGKANLLLTVSY
jgi:hypothetical protein